MTHDFSDELESLRTALAEKQQRLAELRAQRKTHFTQARKARAALDDLRAILRGEKPRGQRSTGSIVKGISSVPVNDDTQRPSRGARKEQIRAICEKVGARGEEFRTADVLNVLRKVESDFSAGMRSYTYTVMNALEEDGFVEKVGRGKWLLLS